MHWGFRFSPRVANVPSSLHQTQKWKTSGCQFIYRLRKLIVRFPCGKKLSTVPRKQSIDFINMLKIVIRHPLKVNVLRPRSQTQKNILHEEVQYDFERAFPAEASAQSSSWQLSANLQDLEGCSAWLKRPVKSTQQQAPAAPGIGTAQREQGAKSRDRESVKNP